MPTMEIAENRIHPPIAKLSCGQLLKKSAFVRFLTKGKNVHVNLRKIFTELNKLQRIEYDG